MLKRGFFLLVTDNDAFALSLSATLQRYSVVRRAKYYRESAAMLLLNSHWSGVVLDLDCFEGNPLETMERVREADTLVPVLAVASHASRALINGLHAMRAELVLKPMGDVNLVSFVQRALVSGWFPDERVAAWVDELARSHALTAREVQLITYALGNESRPMVMRRLGITENTLKTQVRSLLRKCKARSMDGLAKSVLHDALIFEMQQLDTDREMRGVYDDEKGTHCIQFSALHARAAPPTGARCTQ